MHWWRATWAMSSLTICEISRQKTWLILLAAIGIMLLALTNLDAVDAAAHLKLSVSTISGSINFVGTLFAILLVAATITRDREQLVSLTLFPKPLPMSAYVCGRWLGVQLSLAMAIILLNGIGALVVALNNDASVYQMQRVSAAEHWQSLSYFGDDVQPIDKSRCTLGGNKPGSSVRWLFSGLPQQDMTVLIKGRVRAVDPAHIQAPIKVSAVQGQQIPLVLAAASPYGQLLNDSERQASARMVDKGRSHVDLNQDYMRFQLPAAAVADDGSCAIQLTRLDGLANLSFDLEQSCLIARPGGSFWLNMQRGGCVVLAQVAYLSAVALVCACLSNIGVTLFAGLTTFFAALLLRYIQDVAPGGKVPHVILRFLDVLSIGIPDFNQFGIEGLLAGGHAIEWQVIGDAWMYYGLYTCGFLLIAWLIMVRREL